MKLTASVKLKLDGFEIKALTGNATPGPRVTLFEIIPEKGVKVEKIANLNNNIAMDCKLKRFVY